MSEPDWPAADFDEESDGLMVTGERQRRAMAELEQWLPDPEPGLPALEVRPEPCATCPYRQSVPAGIWAEHEYAKLEDYDGGTTRQAICGAVGVFYCHSTPELVCAGWAAVAGDPDNLALRIAAARGHDVSQVLAYGTQVPLWESGHEAALHGRSGIAEPSEAAREAVEKVVKARDATGKPVSFG